MSAITTTIEGVNTTWKDRKRFFWPLALIVPLLPFGAFREAERWDLDVFWFMGPLWILLFLPLIDTLLGTDRGNHPDWAESALDSDVYYRVLTYLYFPLQYAGFFWGAWMVTNYPMSAVAKLGLTLTIGAVGGIGIANAHELGHKKPKFEKQLAKLVLAQTGYGHFEIEHNRGHHTRVSTPEDPATSRFGESFYAFFPRSVIGGIRSGWDLEKRRLARLNQSPWTLKNDVLNAWLMSVVLFGVTIGLFGWAVIPYIVIQAVFGFSLLEVVNYLEHYGLLRQKDENGRYERTAPRHSWNSNHIASNVLLYGLERHSDHHANPTRRYQTLRTFDEAPQLPSGYGTMIGCAYLPPLWRKVMDKRVLAQYGGDITKVNIDPKKREKILARYGAPAETR
ncbi:MAG TPA: alkane 1-monooxygenase [Acidimicrobiaceae bacterium]|jgi:alkane 1-monooxygenase|nr:alkane 1-monooxygenase [Acidimicrobiaceae bacterium]